MALNPNQFAQETVQGQLDLGMHPNTVTMQISENETGTLVAGQAIQIEDAAGGVPQALALTANTDLADGFIINNNKDQSFVAGDYVEIALLNSVMYMTAGAAIARGAALEVVYTTNKVITNAGTNPNVGWAFDKAASDGDLIRVYIEKPEAPFDETVSSLTVTGAASVGTTLAVTGLVTLTAGITGDLLVSGNAIKSSVSYSAGAGALPLTADVIYLTTSGAEALTLADGVAGQELTIKMVSDGGDGTLTPANFLDGTTITFDNTDSIVLSFDGTNWGSIGTPTATIA